MRLGAIHAAVLSGAVVSLFFVNLGGKQFWASHVESRRAEIASNMLKSGDYMAPTLNGKKIFTKPPLYYWTLAASFKINGAATEKAARVPSALFGVATVFLTALIASRLFGSVTAFFSAATLATSYLFLFYSRLAELDVEFAFFITLSFYFLLELRANPGKSTAILFWLSAALGFMVKGPFALMYPLGASLALAPFDEKGRRWAAIKALFPPAGVALFAVIVLPWFLYVIFFDDAWSVFNEEALQRVTSSRGKHHPPLFYLGSLMANFSPWALLLPFALYWMTARDFARENLFPLSWAITGLVVASLISAKNHHYILPLYPAFAIIVGRLLAACAQGELGEAPWLGKTAGFIGLFISGLVFILFVALPVAPFFTGEVPHIHPWLNAAIIPVAGLVFWKSVSFFRAGDSWRLWLGVIANVFILFIFVHAAAMPAMNNRHSHKDFVVAAGKIIKPRDEAAMFKLENFQVSFYLGRPAPVVWSVEDLKKRLDEAFESGDRFFVITRFKDMDEVLSSIGGRTRLVDEWFVPPDEAAKGKRFVLIEKRKES